MTQEPSRSGPDPIGDFQRWLVRSGARSMSREVSGQLRAALGRSSGPDVWERATAPPADEAPECAWCPFCRAARALRDSGPGMTSQVTAATGAMAGLVHDTMSAFESVLAAGRAAAGPGTGPSPAPSGTVWADVTTQDPADTAQDLGDAAQHPGDEPESTGSPGGPPDEPDDRG